MIEINELSVFYDNTAILQSISLTISATTHVGLVGPNGAGKSTLLRSIAGIPNHAPWSQRGHVRVDGSVVDSLSPRVRASLLSYVPQEPLYPASMSVREYAEQGARGISHARRRATAVEFALHCTSLTTFANKKLSMLSGGERRRAAIAQGIAQDTPVLLLDEPLASLDIGMTTHLLRTLQRVQQERARQQRAITIVTSLHQLSAAARYMQPLALLHEGKVLAYDTPQHVLTTPLLSHAFGHRIEVVHLEDFSSPIVVSS